MPMYPESNGREVIYTLRSDEWRKGVREESLKSIEKVGNLILEIMGGKSVCSK